MSTSITLYLNFNFQSAEPHLFAFNGQEKDDEVSGAGNTNTAMFWEYDTRSGRRWNLDPKPQISISDYACLGDNPIRSNDPLGDILDVTNDSGKKDVKSLTNKGNDKYINFDKVGNNYRTKLDFGNLTQDKIDNILNSDKGLSLINSLVNAKEISINYNGRMLVKDVKFIYDVSYVDKWTERGTLKSQSSPLNVFRNDGNSNVLDAMRNYSKTPRNIDNGLGGKDALPGYTSYDGQVTIAPGSFYNTNTLVSVNRASIVFHELEENFDRTVLKIPYMRADGSGAHQSSINKEGSNYSNPIPGEAGNLFFPSWIIKSIFK